jgi:hypothetical protein
MSCRKIDEHEDEIAALFALYGVETYGPVLQSTVGDATAIGATEGALIALGALVVLGSIIGVACVCFTWKQ